MAQRPTNSSSQNQRPKFAELNNLASEKLGGKVLFATDDFFAVAENLLKDSEVEWREGEHTESGKWMDGWETRRKRKPGHDWCIIKLGVAGTIEGVDVDTSYFTGNYVPKISVQAALLSSQDEAMIPERKSIMGSEASDQDMAQVKKINSQAWTTIIPMTDARPGYIDTCHTYIPTLSNNNKPKQRYTHIRLNSFPDGGIARLKVFGLAQLDWSTIPQNQLLDLVSVNNGGCCVGYSDAHYGHPSNLIRPAKALNMFDGWETARRLDRPPILEADESDVLRVPGNEWAILRLGHPGIVHKIEIDTNHFKGNFPDSCRIDGCNLTTQHPTNALEDDAIWKTILPPQKLRGHHQHYFERDVVKSIGGVTHVRVVMAPDGGISRVRIWGTLIAKL